MTTVGLENSLVRGRFSRSAVSTSVFGAADGNVVLKNVKFNATRGGLGEARRLESRLVSSKRGLRQPRGNLFGQQLNCGRNDLTRGDGARSAVVTEQPVTNPVTDAEGSPGGSEKWVIAAEQSFNVFATDAVVKVLESLYSERLYARFYVLETIARVPYFAFVSVLHMYESFGWWRRSDYLKIHFAESWNELHHLLIMESRELERSSSRSRGLFVNFGLLPQPYFPSWSALGGDQRWIDRFLAQHIAVAYYFLTSFMYLVSPRMAYHFSECVEQHAFTTYDKFIKSHGEELKKLPAPAVAIQYYTKGDLYMFDEFQTDVVPHSRRPKIENLYDVFVNIREDEAQHCKTMKACQIGSALRSPHEDVPLTELALDQSALPPVECEGLFECATTASSSADRLRKQGVELAAVKSNRESS